MKADVGNKDFYYLFYRTKDSLEADGGEIDDIKEFCYQLYMAVIDPKKYLENK